MGVPDRVSCPQSPPAYISTQQTPIMQEPFTDTSLSWKPPGLSRESTSLFLEASQFVLTVYHEGGKMR